jgi:hypothetical protein
MHPLQRRKFVDVFLHLQYIFVRKIKANNPALTEKVAKMCQE